MKSTTCLSLGFDPANPDHKSVVCDKCTHFFEFKLNYNHAKHSKTKRSTRLACERPFDFHDSAYPGKVHARERMKSFLAGDAGVVVSSVGCVTPTGPRSRSAASTMSRPHTRSPVPPAPPASSKPSESPANEPKMFSPDGSLSTCLTGRIIAAMDGRTTLNDNDFDLMVCLFTIHSQLNVKSRKPLTKKEERLLGQLSAVAFRTTDVVSVRNYWRAMPIQMAKVPRQRCIGQEDCNRRLQLARANT